jgi:peptidoglycan-N-acetylglucosamine deacetylase
MRCILVLLCFLAGSAVGRAEEVNSCPGNPAPLGTSREAVIGDEGPLAFGLKTYPRTLNLADHEVVLTFDDGPSRGTTPLVLAALEHECVHATFFLIGRNAASAPDLVRREIADGDSVGHHTFSHPAATLRGLSIDKAKADIDRGFAADDKAGYGSAFSEPHVPFFRFPGFADTPALDAWLVERHIAVFGADLWASDWIKMTPDQELDLLMHRLDAAGRGIILLHDIKEQTATMLPKLLDALKQRQYRVVHMVPGHGPTETEGAPPGWHSETEAALAAIMPRLARHAAHVRGSAPTQLRGTDAGLPIGEPAPAPNL